MGILDEKPVEGQCIFTDCPCLLVTTLLKKEERKKEIFHEGRDKGQDRIMIISGWGEMIDQSGERKVQ